MVSAQGDGEFIAVDYAGAPVVLGEGRCYVFNASGKKETVLRLSANAAERTYQVLDCMGKIRQNGTLAACEWVSFEVPLGGSVVID